MSKITPKDPTEIAHELGQRLDEAMEQLAEQTRLREYNELKLAHCRHEHTKVLAENDNMATLKQANSRLIEKLQAQLAEQTEITQKWAVEAQSMRTDRDTISAMARDLIRNNDELLKQLAEAQAEYQQGELDPTKYTPAQYHRLENQRLRYELKQADSRLTEQAAELAATQISLRYGDYQQALMQIAPEDSNAGAIARKVLEGEPCQK